MKKLKGNKRHKLPVINQRPGARHSRTGGKEGKVPQSGPKPQSDTLLQRPERLLPPLVLSPAISLACG